MNDPHVVNLRYKLITPKSTIYDNPPVVKGKCNEFDYCLDNGVLVCKMRNHFPTVKEAQRVVGDFLHSWEIKTALELGRDEIQFQFEDSHMIDRDPPPPGVPKKVNLSSNAASTSNVSAVLHAKRRKYPDPPTVFTVTPDVETLWLRYNIYLDGREEILTMAYFCLTVVENKAGGKKKRESATKLFLIDESILDKLGDLTANRGNAETARKMPEKGKNMIALSGKEKKWIEAAVKILVRRMGELANIQTAKLITMNDLPKI